ncbi:MAG: flippase-like domain-containing protein [Desulfobacteraceae bacterium]|nr:flippase-like domain-containing protein [Desulfobacteraceae bacterium]
MFIKGGLNKFVGKYWLLLFFILIILFMGIFQISFQDIWQAFSSLELWQLGLLFLVYLLISLFLIISRKYLLHSLRSPSKLKNLFLIHFASMTAHYSTPAKLGFPLTVYLLKKLEDIPYATGTAVVLIELVVSTGICGVIAVFGSYFYFADKASRILPFLLLFVLCVLGLCVVGVILRKKTLKSPLFRFIGDLYDAFKRLDRINTSLYIAVRLFIQVFSGVSLMLLARFFSSDLSLLQAVVAGSTAFFLGALSMIPMGLGVREASVLFYLHYVGIPNEVGLSIVTIQRLLSTGLSFALGMLLGTLLGVKNLSSNSNTKKNEIRSANHDR